MIFNESEEYIEVYSNEEPDPEFEYIKILPNKNIYTKAIDIWKYYKTISNENNRTKKNILYSKLNRIYGNPVKYNNVICYPGIIIQI
jgi:hypothetical protein